LQRGQIVDPQTTRSFERRNQPPAKYENEWFTTTFVVKLARQVAEVGESDVELGGGAVTIRAHSGVKAGVSLNPIATATRGAGGDGELLDHLSRLGLEPVSLANTRSVDGPGQFIELTDIQNDELLKDDPLTLSVGIPTDESETLLSATFDGEHFLLVGETSKEEDGSTTIKIHQVPDVASNRRSVAKSLKLYFLKSKLGIANVNKLQHVSYDTGSPRFSEGGLADRVAGSQNILLLIHGLLGNTATMAASLVPSPDLAKTSVEPYDLVLAYDYENISTPVEETARLLQSELEKVGLNESDGKTVTILASGMGGLVARWYIEQEGGGDVVDHLVMCGTPNGGSPLGQVGMARKIVSALSSLALNIPGLGLAILPTAMLAMEKSKKFTVTLEQLGKQSALLTTLGTSSAPGVRYTALAGDVSKITGDKTNDAGRLVEKIGKSFVASMLLGDRHDVTASVDSTTGLNRSWQPAPAIHEVACHHLGYFTSDEGIGAVRSSLGL
ncbi:MAG: hypothetical protein HKN13_01115, partial [Rhodothermales bacterium]|nr:hypothetical protein [Rhodothermales bacterium]